MLESTHFQQTPLIRSAKASTEPIANSLYVCPNGLSCGSILWESKRTKSFSKAWLPKLRDDQRAARASIAVIVTQAMPDGIETFALVDGVWVCSWQCAKGLAMALRAGLIEVSKSQARFRRPR